MPASSPTCLPARRFADAPGRAAVVVLVLTSAALFPLTAQQPREPSLGYVYPAGGRAGSTFIVQLGGQALEGATNLYLNGGGAEAVLLDYTRPLTQREFNQLRNELEQLQEKRRAASGPGTDRVAASTNAPAVTWTDADGQRLAEIRRELATRAPNRQANPALAEKLTFRVTLPADATPGPREVRLRTAAGLTAPLPFHVGALPEVKAPEPAAPAESTPVGLRAARTEARPVARSAPLQVDLPVVVNGRILPGEVDRFRFTARRGQRLVLMAQARALIPYLADAVPGWFQAVLTLRDPQGNEVAYCDDYRLQPDPVILYEVPADGTYTVEIRDALYRGRNDFVYRLTLGEMPFVTGVEPLGVPVGQPRTLRLFGWNLPLEAIPVNFDAPSLHRLYPPNDASWLNEVWIAVDALPEETEVEVNDSVSAAQRLSGPVVVNGRIERPGDADWYAWPGRAGEEMVVEVLARRLGSPLDSRVVLTDAHGREIAANDDQPDPGRGLDTHHADSYLRVALPAAGPYLVRLEDAQGKGGREFGYRLRVGPPQPDFALRVAPSAVNARAGATVPLTVWALRRDGFDGDIHLALADPPPGFHLSGAWVPAGQDKVHLTLTVPAEATPEPVSLRMEGRARVAGRELVRPVVPADERQQAFFYQHLVPAGELLVTVLESPRPAPRVHLLSATPVQIPLGGTAAMTLGVPFPRWAAQFQLNLDDAPEGLALAGVAPSRHGVEVRLRAEGDRLQPGRKGNLILTAHAPRANATTNRPAAAPAPPRRGPAAMLPAIPFEIVAGGR